jgi:hypothetical protein
MTNAEAGSGHRLRAMEACRVALERGWLIKDAHHWRYRGRLFHNATVKRLIQEGTAVRVGCASRPCGSLRVGVCVRGGDGLDVDPLVVSTSSFGPAYQGFPGGNW